MGVGRRRTKPTGKMIPVAKKNIFGIRAKRDYRWRREWGEKTKAK